MSTAKHVERKRTAWNKGKRKPITDEFGDKWCDCVEPKLVSRISRGTAWCVKCMTPYYH